MKISHEMPLALLADGTEKKINDYFYALVHLFEDHEEYYQYVVDQLKAGRDVILDNSAYELHGQPFDTRGFVNWIQKLVKDTSIGTVDTHLTYIIPDEFDDQKATYARAANFLMDYPELNGRAMVVCQGESMHELSQIFQAYLKLPGVAKIGINFMSKAYTTFSSLCEAHATKDKWAQRMIGRKYFLEHLYHTGLLGYKPLHLLGAALPGEFRYYNVEHPKLSEYIETIDTSAPIIYGMFSNELFDVKKQLTQEKLPQKLAEHLLDPIDENTHTRIMENARTFRAYTLGLPVNKF